MRPILLVGSVVLLGLLLFYILSIHDFLAVNRPLNGQVLVVEGWFPQVPGMKDAAQAIQRGNYRSVLCVAVDLPDAHASQALPSSQRAANRLIQLGVDAKLIHVLSVPAVNRDRTYQCALAVRAWLQEQQPDAVAIDVFTAGIHARKSQILYQKALSPGVNVGVIAATESAYPFTHWWLSRHGIYLIVRNTIGYFYALAHSR